MAQCPVDKQPNYKAPLDGLVDAVHAEDGRLFGVLHPERLNGNSVACSACIQLWAAGCGPEVTLPAPPEVTSKSKMGL